MIEIRKAERKKAKLRIGMSGPSGSGKTYSSLRLARELASDWPKIVIIDTENGSADLYSHLGDYNVLTLKAPFTSERYIEMIKACEAAGMEVVIIDSASHEHEAEGGSLETNEKLAQAKFKGNSWSAWSETGARHRKFLEAIISSPCHIISTLRSKTETVMTEDKKVKKVGMKDIQREGFEYEMTLMFNLDRDTHTAVASKDRTELFIDVDPFVINEETGKKLKAWAESGKDEKIVLIESIKARMIELGKTPTPKSDKYLDGKNFEELKKLDEQYKKDVIEKREKDAIPVIPKKK